MEHKKLWIIIGIIAALWVVYGLYQNTRHPNNFNQSEGSSNCYPEGGC